MRQRILSLAINRNAGTILNPEISDGTFVGKALEFDLVEVENLLEGLRFPGEISIADLVENHDGALRHQRQEVLQRNLGRLIQVGIEDQHGYAELGPVLDKFGYRLDDVTLDELAARDAIDRADQIIQQDALLEDRRVGFGKHLLVDVSGIELAVDAAKAFEGVKSIKRPIDSVGFQQQRKLQIEHQRIALVDAAFDDRTGISITILKSSTRESIDDV
jgi:hypothetical protein